MFRFTIRDVLWLTVVVGLGCGWGLDRSYLADLVATYEKSFDAMKLFDVVNPNWREDTAKYIREESLAEPNP